MKTTNSHFPKKGFTLVELLVVIAIIAILAGLATPGILSAQKKAKQLATKRLCVEVVQGVEQYYADFGRLPADPALTAETAFDIDTNTAVFIDKSQPGNELNGNSKGIKYLAPREAKNTSSQGGIYNPTSGDLINIQDSWGNPLKVLLDSNYDEEIKIDAGIESVARTIRGVNILCYSVGPDGSDAAADFRDNVYSWK